MPLVNSEFNVMLIWGADCAISSATEATTITITDTKCYILVVTLSTQNNAKLLQQLKSGF